VQRGARVVLGSSICPACSSAPRPSICRCYGASAGVQVHVSPSCSRNSTAGPLPLWPRVGGRCRKLDHWSSEVSRRSPIEGSILHRSKTRGRAAPPPARMLGFATSCSRVEDSRLSHGESRWVWGIFCAGMGRWALCWAYELD